MKNYSRSFTRVLRRQDILISLLAQSSVNTTLVFESCNGTGDVPVTDGEEQFCLAESPAIGELITFRCSESGSTDYTLEVTGSEGGTISCNSGFFPFLISSDITPTPPSTCTLTSFVVQSVEFCD